MATSVPTHSMTLVWYTDLLRLSSVLQSSTTRSQTSKELAGSHTMSHIHVVMPSTECKLMKSIMIIDCMQHGQAVGKALHKDAIQDCTYCIQSNRPADIILQSDAHQLESKEQRSDSVHAAVTSHMASDLKVTTSL